MPAEKSVSKASENRRSNKPLMEKRRRARINQSLTELKSLILDAVKKDSSRHSKLEKADILEMTVKYLQNLQRQQLASKIAADPDVVNKFRAGFGECANEVSRFLDGADSLETAVRTRLLGHLTTCLTGLEKTSTAMSTSSTTSTASSPSSSSAPSSPSASPSPPPATPPSSTSSVDINNNSRGSSSSSKSSSSVDTVFSGLQLIPTRLANGEIAFILPTHHALAAAQALSLGRVDSLPIVPRSSSSSPNSPLVAQVSPLRTEPSPEEVLPKDETLAQDTRDSDAECDSVDKPMDIQNSPDDPKVPDEPVSPDEREDEPLARCEPEPVSPLERVKLDDIKDEPVWRPW